MNVLTFQSIYPINQSLNLIRIWSLAVSIYREMCCVHSEARHAFIFSTVSKLNHHLTINNQISRLLGKRLERALTQQIIRMRCIFLQSCLIRIQRLHKISQFSQSKWRPFLHWLHWMYGVIIHITHYVILNLVNFICWLLLWKAVLADRMDRGLCVTMGCHYGGRKNTTFG